MSHIEICNNLWLGNQYSTKIFDGEYILSIGCNSLKSCANNIKLSIKDNEDADLTTILPDALLFINKALNKNKKILVHCKGGINRSPAIIIAYLVIEKLFTVEEAYVYVKNKKPSIRRKEHFMQDIIKYKNSLEKNILNLLLKPMS